MTHPVIRTADRRAARALVARALRTRRRLLGAAVLGAAVHVATLLVLPLVTQRAVDDVVVGGNTRKLWGFIAVLIALGILRAVFGGLRKYYASALMAAAGNDVREELFDHLQRLSFSYHDRIGVGQLMSRASSDITAMETAIGMVPFFLQSVALGLGGIVLLLVLQPALAGSVVAVLVLLSLGSVWFSRKLHEMSLTFQERVGVFAQFVEQRVNGIRVVKGLALEARHLEHGDRLGDDIREVGVRVHQRRGAFMSAFSAGLGAAMLIVMAFGGWLGASGRLTPGEFLAFMQYLGMLVAPVLIGAQVLVIWPQAAASSARVAEVLAARADLVDPSRPQPLPAGPGTVRLQDVTFGYRTGVPVLHDLSLEIAGGTSVALVGLTGCGKSTIARLVPRFYDPWEGQVLLDGAPLSELRLRELRSAVSMVFEDTVIFSGTVFENIELGRPGASEADVRRAADLAQADPFVQELPDGYATVVGEQGMTLSAGQRQRIAIARALLRAPRVLILDDAMSAVDPTTDASIRAGLAEAMHDRTTIIIAHRVETVRLADRVILMDRGRIAADGRHDELLELAAYRAALGIADEPRIATTRREPTGSRG